MRLGLLPLAIPLAFPLLAACGDAASPTTGSEGPIDRGPRALVVDGDPNGLIWDDAAGVLYLADDDNNRILRWTDRDGFGKGVDLPVASSDGAGLGQLVRTGDGTFAVTRFGFGNAGDVAFASAAGKAGVVPGLDRERRRIGLTVSARGDLYDAYFVRTASGARAGAVAKLSLTGGEAEVVTGLSKPIGVLAVGEDLFISDQDLGQILRAPIADPAAKTVFATVAQPDLLAEGPDGSLFTGSAGGVLYQVAASGAPAVFQSGFQQVRGVAYDRTHRRVFVVDHDGNSADGVTNTVHILPVP